MTFTAIPLEDLPKLTRGFRARPISPEDQATADAIAIIIASGQAAQTSEVYTARNLAENAGRSQAALTNKANAALGFGLVYRFRVLDLEPRDPLSGDGLYTFVIVPGNAAKTRAPRTAKSAE